jgi:hypothetical protein
VLQPCDATACGTLVDVSRSLLSETIHDRVSIVSDISVEPQGCYFLAIKRRPVTDNLVELRPSVATAYRASSIRQGPATVNRLDHTLAESAIWRHA